MPDVSFFTCVGVIAQTGLMVKKAAIAPENGIE